LFGEQQRRHIDQAVEFSLPHRRTQFRFIHSVLHNDSLEDYCRALFISQLIIERRYWRRCTIVALRDHHGTTTLTMLMPVLYAERVGAQLDDVLAGRWLPATWQTRIYSPCELPVRVERCVRVLGPRVAWRAYTDSAQIFCAVARVRSLVSCGATTAALEVLFLDSDAEIYAGAVWAYDRNPGWCLHSILQLPGTMARPRLLLRTQDIDSGWR
jgi:hypothetical protein